MSGYTKTYSDGTTAIGPSPLPEQSPAAPGSGWAEDLGQLSQGDIELLDDAIEALLQPRNALARDHALHGLQTRVALARRLAWPTSTKAEGECPSCGGVEWAHITSERGMHPSDLPINRCPCGHEWKA